MTPARGELDPAVQPWMGIGVRRHHLKRDVAQPAHLQQTFELPPPHRFDRAMTATSTAELFAEE